MINLFRKNLLIKLMSVITAIIIHAYVEMGKRIEKVIRVPLVIENQPSRLAISQDLPKFVSIYLQGSRLGITEIIEERLLVVIDLKGKKSGLDVYQPVLKGDLPGSVIIERMSPDKISIDLSAAKTKLVTVKPQFVNSPSNDFVIEKYRVYPQRIYISGPENIIEDIIEIDTSPIDLKGIENDTKFKVKISKNINPLIDLKKWKDGEITVSIKVDNLFEEVMLRESIPIDIKTPLPNNLSILEKKPFFVNTVDLEVHSDYLEKFDFETDIQFYVNLDQINQLGQYEVEIEFTDNENFKIKDFFPNFLKLTVVDDKREDFEKITEIKSEKIIMTNEILKENKKSISADK